MTFGERVAILRKRMHVTQRELAKLVGMGVNTINNYERGLQRPHNREVYARLAEVLGVRVDDLICEDENLIRDPTLRYQNKGKDDALALVEKIGDIFSNGSIDEDDRDAVMIAMEELYWEAKYGSRRCPPNAKRIHTQKDE